MNTFLESFGSTFRPSGMRFWKRRLILAAVMLLVGGIVIILTWDAFFEYVPPGNHLIIIAKDGEPLTPGQVLAKEGQKGIQEEVKGEGWHFVLPIVYTTEVEENTEIPAGSIGLVTARGGKPLPPGRVLAEEGEQGIQRRVLPPGSYRINKHGYDVTPVPATEIKPGFVGVLRRLLGKDGKGRFTSSSDEKGILREILQPGLYYLNPKEYEVIPTKVGIFQTAFHYDSDPKRSTAITFTSKGGLPISMDCTVEWEVLPEDMPALVAEYGSRQIVERNVIDVQAHAISRDKGIEYGVQHFLEGSKREAFQTAFTEQLTKICREKDVTIRSAFIRNIVIPEAYLKPIRDKQIAVETEVTNKVKEVTAEIGAEVEREQQMIPQREAEVVAATTRIVAGIDREVENVGIQVEAEVDKMKADYGAQIAVLDSQRLQLLGEAEAKVTKLKETARGSIYQLKMNAFQNNSEAFLRYSLAEQINPKLILRLFHSGEGTLWTNMDGKGLDLLLPTGGQPMLKAPAKPPASK